MYDFQGKLKIGDIVILNKDGLEYANGIYDKVDVSKLAYEVVAITNAYRCSEMEGHCTCDKYIDVYNIENDVKINDLLFEEINIFNLKENL